MDSLEALSPETDAQEPPGATIGPPDVSRRGQGSRAAPRRSWCACAAAVLFALVLAACGGGNQWGAAAPPPSAPPTSSQEPTPADQEQPALEPDPPAPPPAPTCDPATCLGACCQGACCVGGRCDDSGACAVAALPPPPPQEPPPAEEPPPPPVEESPPPDASPIAHTNELGGISFTYYSFLPLGTHDGWSALQAIEAWSSSSTETTWNVCGRSGCYCRRRGGTNLVATICPDVRLCAGCEDIGASGYATATVTKATSDGLPRCAQVETLANCPTPDNAARVPWR